jgi:glycerol-3-phosphate acyltransferase PlsY
MEFTFSDMLLVVFAYSLGSVSSAIIICKLLDLPDPRTQGSGNPGATNVMRLGGKKAAAATLAGDLLKGLVPVILAQSLKVDINVLCAVGMAAFLGHLYPVFFGFRGGKGVATAIGVLIGMSWQVAIVTVGTWLLMFSLFRISSLSALTAFLLTPLYAWWLQPEPVFIVTVSLISLLLFWRHRSNIKKLIQGTED